MKSAIDRRDHLRPGSRECQCPACGLCFLSPRGFTLHRTGKVDARRCLTARELKVKGWTKDGKERWGMGTKEGGAGQVPGGQDR